jgi:hypothetical protein
MQLGRVKNLRKRRIRAPKATVSSSGCAKTSTDAGASGSPVCEAVARQKEVGLHGRRLISVSCSPAVERPVMLMLQARACRIRILWRWFCWIARLRAAAELAYHSGLMELLRSDQGASATGRRPQALEERMLV